VPGAGYPRHRKPAPQIDDRSQIVHASKSLSALRAPSFAPALALVSVVCGVLGFLTLSLLFGPLAVLTGHLALTRSGNSGTVLAKTGVLLGITVLVLYAVLLAARP
jgi:hypothetical protein